MAAIILGSGALAGAGAITGVTRGPWRVTAALAGAGAIAGVTRGPWRVTAALAGATGFVADNSQPIRVDFPIPAPLAAIPAYRTFAAPPGQGVSSARSIRAVTPSDTVALDPGCVGLMVTVTGTVTVKGLFDGATTALGSQAAGTLIQGRFAYVMSNGTAATVTALYV